MAWQQGLVLAAVMVLLPLGLYAGWLLGRLWRQGQLQRQQQAALAAHRRQHMLDSIRTIARAMQIGQCELAEGVLRIGRLLELLVEQDKPELARDFPAMAELYQVVAEMPTHDARKQHKRNQIMKWDLERVRAEERLQPAIEQELPQLLAWCAKYPE